MAKKETEYQLAIRIKANMDKTFGANLKTAESKVKGFRDSVDGAFKNLDGAYGKISSTLGNTVKLTATASAAVAGIAVKTGKEIFDAGNEFESAFAGVKKTVDATDEEFANLRSNILDLSKEIPATANEIAATMEIAGQLGIANENLTEFTKTMINLGVSTNMTSEEVATALARFSNITNMDPSKYEALGSVVVDLGNNFATTESEIVEMATRLASTGEIVRLSEAEIMAAATAMSSLGIEAQAGSSSLSKLLLRFEVASKKGDDLWKTLASVAGMTGEEFTNLYNESALKAIGRFAAGLNDTERNGKSAAVLLQDLGFKEVRLTRTLLSLASGNDLLYNAMERAEEAWKENTALAEEAGKRYETMESRVQILKNSLTDLKVESYDTLRVYFAEGVEWLQEKLEKLGDWITGREGLTRWIEKAKSEMPKLTTNAKKFWTQVKPIADNGTKVLKYAVQHPDALAKLFIGVGAALVTYNLVKGVSSIVTGIGTLASNPVALGIVALTAAIGGVATIIHTLNEKEEELIRTNLEEHFGNISLSMGEIEDAANHLLNADGALDRLHSAFEEWNIAESIEKQREDIEEEINKYNWKIYVGIGLNEDESTGYKNDIQEYIEACNEYIAQHRYALDVSLSLFVDDYEGSSLESNVRNYGEVLQNNMEGLGRQLASYANKAFADNFLDEEEAAEIAKRMQRIAELQNSMATGRQEAALKMLGLETDYSNLDADSFEALLQKAQEIEDQAAEERKEAYVNAYSGLNAMFKGKDLEDAIAQLDQGYYKLETESKLKTVQWAIDAMQKAFGEELGALDKADYASDWEQYLRDNGDLMTLDMKTDAAALIEDELEGAMKFAISNKDRKAAQKFLDYIAPGVDDMEYAYEKYLELGGEGLKGVEDALTDSAQLELIGTEITYSWDYIADHIDLSEGSPYGNLYRELYNAGVNLPFAILRGIGEGVKAPFSGLKMPENLDSYFEGSGGSSHTERSPRLTSNTFITAHAAGGIFGSAHLGLVAENGPESIIPLNGSREARLLWKRTGELMGLRGRFSDLDSIGGGGYEVNYSPTIVFNGAAPSKADLDAANDRAQERFEQMIEKYFRTKARVAF